MSEMERLFRGFDWAATSIGPPESWPVTWRNAVRIILDSSSPIAIGLGPQLLYFYNDAFIPLGGPDRHASALGQPVSIVWKEIWPDILRPRFSQTLATGLPTGEADLMMPLLRSGYLEETYISFSFAPLRDDAGRPSGIFCTATDNTERVVTQRQMSCLQRLAAQGSFAASPESACRTASEVLERQARDVPFALFYLLDRTGAHADLTASCGLVGRPNAVPQSIEAASRQDSWQLATALARRAPIFTEGVHGLIGPALRRPELIPQLALTLPLGASAGLEGPAGILVVGMNPMRPVEESRAFHLLVAQQLQTAISTARARQSAEQRARQLVELNRAKSVFLSNVSHELRTPLTLLLSPLEQLLQDAKLDDASRERAAIASRAGRRLLKLVNSLLQFSRAESGRIDAHFEPADLASLTADLASMFRSLIERAGITFHVECPPIPQPIYVDPDMWERIVLNLLSNAFKFTMAGEIAVRLRSMEHGVALEVSDTGCGIADKDLPHLFQRFFRGEASQARSVEGTGIGLSLVRELAKAHGGSVAAQSIQGAGTTITVIIPRGTAHLPPDRIRAPRATARLESEALPYIEEALGWLPEARAGDSPGSARARVATLDGERILVVDDNTDMRSHLSRLLEARWRVSVAPDGLSALAQIRASPPDLVLADVMMPGLDGLGLLHALRKDPATEDIPVLLLSARAGDEASAEGLSTGAEDYIVKPFSARDVISRIELRLSQARAAATLRRARAAAEEAGHARDEFFATLFHELRTPLASLQTWIGLLKSGRLPRTQIPAALEALDTSSQSLSGLVQDLLDYSAVIRGELRVEPRPLPSLTPVIKTVVQAFQPVAQMRDLILTCETAGPGGPVKIDTLRLQQVIWNLLSNAIRHTSSGGRIAVTVVAAGDSEIEVVVRDSGCGIPADELPYVFGRYWRGKAAGSGGLGLGLAIAQRIVELHGGNITVHSDGAGRGAEFSLRLPVSVDNTPIEPGTPSREEDASVRLHFAVSAATRGVARQARDGGAEALEILEGIPSVAPESLRILLVEDDDGLAGACQRLLSLHGHRVVRAKGCAGALAALGRERIDLILSDVQLADGNAFQLLERVRSLLHRPVPGRLPVIAMSAFLPQREIARYRAAGFAAQIGKPFEESTLLRAIREALRHGALAL